MYSYSGIRSIKCTLSVFWRIRVVLMTVGAFVPTNTYGIPRPFKKPSNQLDTTPKQSTTMGTIFIDTHYIFLIFLARVVGNFPLHHSTPEKLDPPQLCSIFCLKCLDTPIPPDLHIQIHWHPHLIRNFTPYFWQSSQYTLSSIQWGHLEYSLFATRVQLLTIYAQLTPPQLATHSTLWIYNNNYFLLAVDVGHANQCV